MEKNAQDAGNILKLFRIITKSYAKDVKAYKVESETSKLKQNILIFFIISINFILDRISKLLIIDFFSSGQSEYYVNSYLNFILIWNKGIAFGLFGSEDFIYHFTSFLIFSILLLIIFMIIKSNKLFEKVCFSILLGGALGNFFDRIYYQAVPDFIDFHYNNFHWFVFNVSDISITFGIILLIFYEIIKKQEKNE